MMHEVSSNRPLARRRRLEQALGLLPKAMPHHQCRCCFCVCRRLVRVALLCCSLQPKLQVFVQLERCERIY